MSETGRMGPKAGALFCALVLCGGCSGYTYQPDISIFDSDMDMSVPVRDLASNDDFAQTPHDLAGIDFSGRDLEKPADLTMVHDLARPMDLSMPPDLLKPPNADVWCGMNNPLCGGGKPVCCYDANLMQGMCVVMTADCAGTPAFACDDPSDCAPGEACCGGPGGAKCLAFGACQDHRLCVAQMQCQLGESCCPFVLDGYSYCLKGLCP